MSTSEIMDIAAGVLLLGGGVLTLIAAIGLLRFPDLLTRMHSATKPQVLGLLLVVGGLALRLRDPSATAILVIVAISQMITAPVASHMVGRASYRAGQARGDMLVTDELGEALPKLKESRGAP